MYVVLSLGTRDEIRVSACRRVQSELEKVNCIWQFLTNMTLPFLKVHELEFLQPGQILSLCSLKIERKVST